MYNILTCDDEQIMIDSLQFIIRKNFEGQVNLFSALSGSDAVSIASREKIDIIFMDINMPGMSGLEAISCIKSLKPSAVIIVLSAFDKFQYAQEAMNIGAYKYITKPVNRNVVIQTVRNAMNLVDERAGTASGNLKLQKKLDIVYPIIESDFIYSCIFSKAKNEDFQSYLDYFNMKVDEYFFACIEIPGSEKNIYDSCSKVRRIVSQKFKCLAGSFMSNRIAVFVSVEKSAELPEDDFHFAAKEIFTLLSVEIGQKLRAGISGVCSRLEEVFDSCKDAIQALNRTSPDGGILFADELLNSCGDDEKVHELYGRILNRLKIGDIAGVQFLAEVYISELYEHNFSLDKIKGNVFEALIEAKNSAKSAGSSWKNSAFENIFSDLSRIDSKAELQNFFKNRLSDCAAFIYGLKDEKENPLVKKVFGYIQEHIAENFSLDDAASFAGVSSFYLSKLFKEETGETFINYVTDRRLEKARLMLCNTGLSIKEISAEIGYNDQNYFSRIFKNKFGISPTDFRSTSRKPEPL